MPGAAGLYYPWIHFRDDDWVKVAMLYWRVLRRIVPTQYSKQDSPTVRAFVDQDLIGDLDAAGSRERVASGFAQVLHEHRDALREHYASHAALLWENSAPVRHFAVPGVHESVSDRFAYIHVDKMATSLRSELIESGLGVANRGGDRDWLGVHPNIARVYMTALAQDIAERGGLQPIAETTFDHIAVGGWSIRQLTAALLPGANTRQTDAPHEDPVAALAFIAIRSLIPKDVSGITAEQVLEVRAKYGPELVDFQDAVRTIAVGGELSEVSDPAAFQMHLNLLYEDRLAPKLARLQHDLRLFRIDMIPTWLGLRTTLPPAAAVAATGVGLSNPAVGAAGAIALGVVGMRHSAATAAQAKMLDNPAAYMLRINDLLAPNTLRKELKQGFRRFTLGV